MPRPGDDLRRWGRVLSRDRVARGVRRWIRRAWPPADRQPPQCPPGWHTGPPDFVGIGVQRAGTTWWFAEVTQHPDVAQADGALKEVHFFTPLSDRDLGPDDVARYEQWFPRPPGAITGEWTPAYVYHPWSIPLLAQAAPGARLLLMLRDPMDRLRSAVPFLLRRGRSHEDAVVDAFHRGLYSNQVARVLEHAGRDRVLVLTYEQVLADPDAARRTTAEFVGLDPDRFPAAVAIRPAPARARGRRDLPKSLEAELNERFRDDVAALARLLPDVDLGRWPTASGLHR